VFPGARLGMHVSRFLQHPSPRASTPTACHRHIPCPTRSAPPIGLCVAHSSAVACAVVVQGWVGQELIFFWPPLAQPLRHCSMPPLRVWLTHVYDRVVTPRVGAPGPSAYVTGPGKWSC